MTNFETECAEQGVDLLLLWETGSPLDERVEKMRIYLMDRRLAVVAHYAGGQGWDVFTRRDDLSFEPGR